MPHTCCILYVCVYTLNNNVWLVYYCKIVNFLDTMCQQLWVLSIKNLKKPESLHLHLTPCNVNQKIWESLEIKVFVVVVVFKIAIWETLCRVKPNECSKEESQRLIKARATRLYANRRKKIFAWSYFKVGLPWWFRW